MDGSANRRGNDDRDADHERTEDDPEADVLILRDLFSDREGQHVFSHPERREQHSGSDRRIEQRVHDGPRVFRNPLFHLL